MDKKQLGRKLNLARKDRGLTSEKLSEICNLNATYVRQIEAGTIEDEEGNRKRLTWRDVALRVYRKDDENAIRATTRFHKRALESVKRWVSDQ